MARKSNTARKKVASTRSRSKNSPIPNDVNTRFKTASRKTNSTRAAARRTKSKRA